MYSPQKFPILSKGTIDPVGKSNLNAAFLSADNYVSWSTYNFDLTNLDDPTIGNVELSAVQEIGILIEHIINERTKSMNLPDKPLYL